MKTRNTFLTKLLMYAQALPAGSHLIRIGAQCTAPAATVNGGTVTLIGITSIIVLP